MIAVERFLHLRYLPVLKVSVEHGYYPDGYCQHIYLEPSTAATRRMVAEGLRFIPSAKGGTLLAEMNGTGMQGFQSLPFLLRVRNPEVLGITALAAQSQPHSGAKVPQFRFENGVWVTGAATLTEVLPSDCLAVLELDKVGGLAVPPTVTFALEAPTVVWTYRIWTGLDYAIPLQIAGNGKLMGTAMAQLDAADAALQSAQPGKRLQVIKVSHALRSTYPAWYLHDSSGIPFPELPALPKPRFGTGTELSLDYSTKLK